MDHDGQLKEEGRMAPQGHVDAVGLCDNGALTAQNLNLNEANILTQTQGLTQSERGEEGRCSILQKSYFNNNGREEEEEVAEQGKKGYTGSNREVDEDADEVMDEDEESEESSSLIRCQSPDTPMTDSSYSETGSLLETSCPFSPVTSPEPTSPVIPVVSPVEVNQCGSDLDMYTTNTESGTSSAASISCKHGLTFTTGPLDLPPQTENVASSSSTVSSPCIPENTERITTDTEPSTVSLPQPTESTVSSGSTCVRGSSSSCTGLVNSKELPTFTTESTAIDYISTAGPVSPHLDCINSTPMTTCSSVSACTKGPIATPALLESLQQLAEKGDDIQLPQYLHQIAEAFVLQEDYQRALWCIQLERVYHQRVLENLKTLQEQWETQCERTSSDLATKQLDTLKIICQTHTWPRTRDAECTSLDFLGPKFEEGAAGSSCISATQEEGGMEQRLEDSTSSVIPSIDFTEKPNSPEVKQEEDPDSVDGSRPGCKQTDDVDRGEAEGGVGGTTSIMGKEPHPSTVERMDQSEPAEQQGQDLDSGAETEAKPRGESDVEKTEGVLEMDEEGDEEEEEKKQRARDSSFCQEALLVETLVSGTDVEEQLLQEDAKAQEILHEMTTLCQNTQEAYLLQYANVEQQEQQAEEEEEEEEEDYEVDQARIIREAPSLDNMAKLITVEEISPASGLVSILKKRNVYLDQLSLSDSSESQPEKPTAKRRVRFKVPDDGYDHDVGSADSCLLLFLLCLVTVVISVGGTALYCALGDAQSSVCQDFSRNAEFYFGQLQRGITQIQHWFASGS